MFTTNLFGGPQTEIEHENALDDMNNVKGYGQIKLLVKIDTFES